MARTVTLTYTGTQTIDVRNETALHDAIDAVVAADQAPTPVQWDSGSLRGRDSDVWIQASLSVTTSIDNIDTAEQTLAQALVEIGFEPDLDTASDEITLQ
jgi:hypothetical protein